MQPRLLVALQDCTRTCEFRSTLEDSPVSCSLISGYCFSKLSSLVLKVMVTLMRVLFSQEHNKINL
jgi:hypothetical protein